MIRNTKIFFQYVIPSILAFALSGIYSIVDGFFVGNQVGDAGLSAINVAYPIVALIQAAGTGIGMGGAVCYSKSQPPLQVVVWVGPHKGRLHARPKGRVSQALSLVRL